MKSISDKPIKVFVYRNLHQQGHVYSIKALEGPLKGRVVGHANGLILSNCELRVSEAGRQRVLKTKRKNVHAGVVGELVAATGYRTRLHNAGMNFEYCSVEQWVKKYPLGTEITYNPYLYSSFVIKGSHSAIKDAPRVQILNGRVDAYFAAHKPGKSDRKI